MVGTILLGLLFLVLLYLLLVPIKLCLNTIKNQYYLQIHCLAKASIEGHKEELLQIRLNVLFMNFHFYPLKHIGPPKTMKIEKSKPKRLRRRIGIKKTTRVLKSFKVKQLLIDIDTGDCLMNAKLYPLFSFINYHKERFNINFEGRNQLVLHLQNRPIRIIKSFINF